MPTVYGVTAAAVWGRHACPDGS